MNLFDMTAASDHLAERPRDATVREVRAYLDYLAARRGIAVPSDATYGHAGIYCPTSKAYILDMPGYGQSQSVTCELLDDAGEVTRRMILPPDKRGKLPMTAAQAKDWTGLAAVRAPRRKAAPAPVIAAVTPAHPVTEPSPMIDTPAPAIAAEIASAAVPAPDMAPAAVLDVLEAETPLPDAGMTVRIAAAVTVALAAIAAAPTYAATVQGGAALWAQFVTDVTGVATDQWVIASGPQRDRKARNRGKVVISGPDIEAMRAAFDAAMSGPQDAPALPAPAAPVEPVQVAPAPADDLTAMVAALATRVATLERATTTGRAPRTALHAAAIRRAWNMRRAMRERADLDRRALLIANGDNRLLHTKLQQAERDLTAARDNSRKACDRALDAIANADTLRDELTAAETALARRATEFAALSASAAADRARLDQLAPLLAAIGSISQSPAAPAAAPVPATA